MPSPRWPEASRAGLPCRFSTNARCRLARCAPYARPMAAPGRDKAHTLRRLPWYRALPAEDRSWVGLVAQAGISSFITWFSDPSTPPHGASEIFAAAPPELTRSISLQQTLQLVRLIVEVVEDHSDRLAA